MWTWTWTWRSIRPISTAKLVPTSALQGTQGHDLRQRGQRTPDPESQKQHWELAQPECNPQFCSGNADFLVWGTLLASVSLDSTNRESTHCRSKHRAWGWAFGLMEETESWPCSWHQPPPHADPARQQVLARVLGFLPLTREAWIKLWATSFWPRCGVHLGSDSVDGISFYPFLCLSSKQN